MGTIPELRKLIDKGISKGLSNFVKDYETKLKQDAEKSEDKYYRDYSSWYDSYRRYDIKNMDKIESISDSRDALIVAEFSADNMEGGHGVWRPLSDYAADPETVFEWGFETGNHGFYVTKTPVRFYWEQYFRARKQHAKPQALKHVIAGLKSVGL